MNAPARTNAQLATRSNMTIILQAAISGASTIQYASDLIPLLATSAVPAGMQWNSFTMAFESCPAGRYSVGAGMSYQGCQYCPIGTYQSSTGSSSCMSCAATAYCPTGSINNNLLLSTYTQSSVISVIPWFQYDGFQEVFEELLVRTVFGINAYPAMILFFLLTGLCFIVYIASYWADSDGDHQSCCSTPANCCLHTYRLLGRFKYFTARKRGPFPYSKKEKKDIPDIVHYDIHGNPVANEKGQIPQQHVIHNPDGSVTTTTIPGTQPEEEEEHEKSEHSPEFEGYMALVKQTENKTKQNTRKETQW